MRAVVVVRHRLRRNLRGSGVPAMGKARSLDRATVRPEEGPASAPSWRACLSLAPLLSPPAHCSKRYSTSLPDRRKSESELIHRRHTPTLRSYVFPGESYQLPRTRLLSSLALKGTVAVVVSCVYLRPLRPEPGRTNADKERCPVPLAWAPLLLGLLPGLPRFAGHRKQPVHVQGP
jgi:hypothetical protein